MLINSDLVNPGNGKALYTPFQEVTLDIDVRPLSRVQKQPSQGLDYDLMSELLDGYKPDGEDAVYQTVRFEGHRLDEKNEVKADVHIYEMYWNDLSRVGSGVFGFFSTLYLLLFHVGDLGILALEGARTTLPAQKEGEKDANGRADRWSGLWETFLRGHRFAVWLMTLPVPLFNLALLAIGLCVLVCQLEPDKAVLAASILVGLGSFVTATALALKRNAAGGKLDPRWLLPLILVVSIVGGFSLNALLARQSSNWSYGVPVSLMAVLLFAGVSGIARKYEEYRPGAFFAGGAISVMSLVLFLASLWLLLGSGTAHPEQVRQAIATAVLDSVRVIYTALFSVWSLYVVTLLATVGWGAYVALTSGGTREEKGRSLRVWWTSVITLTVPAVLFLAVTLALWSALISQTQGAWHSRRDDANGMPTSQARSSYEAATSYWKPTPIPAAPPAGSAAEKEAMGGIGKGAVTFYFPVRTAYYLAGRDRAQDKAPEIAVPADLYVQTLVTATATPLLPVYAITAALALLFVGWAFLPSIQDESNPPRRDKDHEQSPWKGRWLTSGYQGATVSGVLFLALIGVLLPMGYFFLPTSSWFFSPSRAVETAATPVTATAVLTGIGVMLSRLGALSGKLGSIVGVALDVDNHLRAFPTERTPRARMVTRYVSLLRYLSRWRTDSSVGNRKNGGYDRIVIIAHSQGTVLTADLLRFLQKERSLDPAAFAAREPSLVPQVSRQDTGLPSLAFFTMGCPLRQLYALRFPHLYGWARTDHSGPAALTEPNRDSDPGALGVERWVNVYRSGDYVGRALWQTDQAEDVWDFDKEGPTRRDEKRMEGCLGAGAHTHYWDETASIVARFLDKLIEGSPIQ